jgi:hypothetical protein
MFIHKTKKYTNRTKILTLTRIHVHTDTDTHTHKHTHACVHEKKQIHTYIPAHIYT